VTAPSDLVADFDVEFDRLLHVQGVDEQRRALRSILETLYSLRCHRLDNTQPVPLAYYNRAQACQGGRVTEGIVLIRGQLIHKVTKRHAPEEKDLHPGEDTYPGDFTYPGANLTWLSPTEMRDPLPPDVVGNVRYSAYVADVAGRPVLETLQIARDFLVNDPILGPP
jgi:hypothetical protein